MAKVNLPKIVKPESKYKDGGSSGPTSGLQAKLANVPKWVWYATGAVIAIAIVMYLRRNGGTGSPITSAGAPTSAIDSKTNTTPGAPGDPSGTSSGKFPSLGSTGSGFVTSTSVLANTGGFASGTSSDPLLKSIRGLDPGQSVIYPPTNPQGPADNGGFGTTMTDALKKLADAAAKAAADKAAKDAAISAAQTKAEKAEKKAQKKITPPKNPPPPPPPAPIAFGNPGGGVAPKPKPS